MRRILSISLLLLFMLPLLSPLFAASSADANVPICCRRDGKHHCMSMATIAQSSSDAGKTKTASLHDRCPYDLVPTVAINLPFISDEIQSAAFAGIVSTSAHLNPTQDPFKSSLSRSHQKRGPPSPVFSHS